MRGVWFTFCAATCFRGEDGHDFRVGWVMGIVAIYAVVSGAFPTAEVPVAVHASMATIFVISVMRAVTLGAELHDVREGHRCVVCQTKCFMVVWVMTTHTF